MLCAGATQLSAQGSLIINKYAAVTSRGTACDNSLTVDDATGFNAGDTVLMIQMKGAAIDSSNSAAFGTVLAYNGAGNYEQNLIKSVSGTKITLVYKIRRSYNIPTGLVQLVRVPGYSSYTLSQPHTAMPWNGIKGGVFALNVADMLALNSDINVSGQGFRGGIANATTHSNVTNCNITGYYHNVNIDSSAQKGEGIATVSTFRSYGRGNLANGGGGGNSHNAGGGGGSNVGAAGIGGSQWAGCASASPNITGGLGGLALVQTASANKLFLGGGGGAGHTNDQANADGGGGGGIVIISAGSIAGLGGKIIADGAAGTTCTNNIGTYPCTDGMGGGGGGGCIALNVPLYTGGVSVSAKGGNGANVTGAAAFASLILGPGGGGGGGALWTSTSTIPTAIAYNAAGGANGVNVNQSNNPQGAQSGSSGLNVAGLQYPLPTPADSFKNNAANISFSYAIVSCNTAKFTSALNGIATYLWDFGNGSTSNQANPTFTFPAPGTYTVTLNITDSSGCTGSASKQVVVTIYNGTKKDTSICAGHSVRISTYVGGTSYQWSPATGLSSTNTSATTASPTSTILYTVLVTAGTGCQFRDTFLVTVLPTVKAAFSYSPLPPVANKPILFNNMSTGASSYLWSFGDGATSVEKDPSHLYKRSGSYQVCLIAGNAANCPDTVCKYAEAEVRTIIAVPSAFSPNGDLANDVLFVKGSGVESFQLRIFNRWGQLVFETADFNKGWDGTFKGQLQEIDVYAYVLTAVFVDGSTAQQKGNISLMR